MRKGLMGLTLIMTMMASQMAAFAWGHTGHMVVAQIAYAELNPTAKERVDELVSLLRFKGQTYDHITVATMMDDFRSDQSKNSFKTWHYTNDPFFDGIDPFEINLPEINVQERIEFIVNKLKSGGTGSDRGDAKLVAYLFHLVGDIHQPLHSTTRYAEDFPKGDTGGNSFFIKGRRNKLHSYWDGAGGFLADVRHPLNAAGKKSIKRYASEATEEYPSSNTEWKDMDVSHWVKESHELALSAAYDGIEPGTRPSRKYQARAQEVCRKRLAMAGYRLAELLNEIYPAQ